MGVRYRKSINLGHGFRINISKSGIGGSWGTKGFRVTKTAKGATRFTVSIPGTGLSYVKEIKPQKGHYRIKPKKNADPYGYYEGPIAVDEEAQLIEE